MILQIGQHPTFEINNIYFNLDTIVSLLIVSSFIVLAALVLRFTVLRKSGRPVSLLQMAVEAIYNFTENISTGIMGNAGLVYVSIVSTLFILIFFSNIFGLIPVNAVYSLFFEKLLGRIPELSAPTCDINTTAGLAVTVFLLIHFLGLKNKGLRYMKKFFQPNFFFFPINVLEELAKPFSLAIRLFGNTFGKETIILVLVSITVFPLLYPLPVMFLDLFIGTIQAFIFSLLTAFYIAEAVSEEH
ncbi:MAG: F0F1 ATP synthase subunit A [Candidatus Saganbacteria bacterium]|nr:F0F1 ATP synthase subunit A [Candidatus Saganbacteria bacterium]